MRGGGRGRGGACAVGAIGRSPNFDKNPTIQANFEKESISNNKKNLGCVCVGRDAVREVRGELGGRGKGGD